MYTPLTTLTLAADTSIVTLSNINQSYKDLVLVVGNVKRNAGGSYFRVFVNNYYGTNYATTYFDGSTGYYIAPHGSMIQAYADTSPQSYVAHFLSYTNTTRIKATLVQANGYNTLAGLWYLSNDTSAITTLNIYPDMPMLAGTTISLYGVK